MDSTSSLHQIFKAIKIRKVWFETHTFQPWKNGMNEQHGATNGILFCREWNPWQSTTWICMAVGCCFGKSDPNIWTPRARWSCEPHSRIHKKKQKIQVQLCHFDSKYFCPVFFFWSPAPPNTWNHQSYDPARHPIVPHHPAPEVDRETPGESMANHGNHAVGYWGWVSLVKVCWFFVGKDVVKKHPPIFLRWVLIGGSQIGLVIETQNLSSKRSWFRTIRKILIVLILLWFKPPGNFPRTEKNPGTNDCIDHVQLFGGASIWHVVFVKNTTFFGVLMMVPRSITFNPT